MYICAHTIQTLSVELFPGLWSSLKIFSWLKWFFFQMRSSQLRRLCPTSIDPSTYVIHWDASCMQCMWSLHACMCSPPPSSNFGLVPCNTAAGQHVSVKQPFIPSIVSCARPRPDYVPHEEFAIDAACRWEINLCMHALFPVSSL